MNAFNFIITLTAAISTFNLILAINSMTPKTKHSIRIAFILLCTYSFGQLIMIGINNYHPDNQGLVILANIGISLFSTFNSRNELNTRLRGLHDTRRAIYMDKKRDE